MCLIVAMLRSSSLYQAHKCWICADRGAVYSQMAGPAASRPLFRTLNCCFPCGHQPGLTSHIGAWLSPTDQRLLLAVIVIDMTCGFILAPQMCHSLYKIVGFVWVPMDTAQLTIGECLRASGDTLLGHRVEWLWDAFQIHRTVFVCVFI